jgi:hypothetical protein
MAGCAIVAHGLFVGRVVVVASDTVRWRLTMFLITDMTVAALVLEMGADQFEVRDGVIETVLDKNNYLGVTAFVIGVAGRALVAAGLRV